MRSVLQKQLSLPTSNVRLDRDYVAEWNSRTRRLLESSRVNALLRRHHDMGRSMHALLALADTAVALLEVRAPAVRSPSAPRQPCAPRPALLSPRTALAGAGGR